MKAVIIAGGMGTRLESATPKILHKIGKATILDHQIRHLTENGITQIYLSLGYNNQQVIDYVQKHYYNKNIHFIVEQEPSGTGGFLKLMKKLDESFYACNGDDLTNIDIFRMRELHEALRPIVTIAVKQLEQIKNEGHLTISNNRVTAFNEKPKEPIKGYANLGHYIFSPNIFKEAKRHTLPLSLEKTLFPHLINQAQAVAYVYQGEWATGNTKEEIRKAKWQKKTNVKDGT